MRFGPAPSGAPCLLLVTEEDCNPVVPANAKGFATLHLTSRRSPLGAGARADEFAVGALADARARLAATGLPDAGPFGAGSLPSAIIESAQAAGAKEIVTMHAPVGPVADALARLGRAAEAARCPLRTIVLEWDKRAWPHARSGFFSFKERIPGLLEACDYDKAPAFL
jgi:deoxyribodipyrimidine photo-lyase